MSEINFPISVQRKAISGGKSITIFQDKDGNRIDLTGEQIVTMLNAAALNAAPKRAFADLTAEALKEMRDAARDRGINSAGLPKQGEGMPRHWRRCNAAIDAEFLSLLQAFAAPA